MQHFTWYMIVPAILSLIVTMRQLMHPKSTRTIYRLNNFSTAAMRAFDVDHNGQLNTTEFNQWHQLHQLSHKGGGAGATGTLAAQFVVYCTNTTNGTEACEHSRKALDALTYNIPELPVFAVVVALWATVALEMWKRKEAEVAFRWGMSDYERQEEVRPEYRADKRCKVARDAVTAKDTIYFPPAARARTQVLSLSITLTLVVMVCGAASGVVVFRLYLQRAQAVLPAVLVSPCAAAVNVAQMGLMGWVYRVLAVRLNDMENHRTTTQYEDSLIVKMFLFQFINNYFVLFFIAFVEETVDFMGAAGCPQGDCVDLLGQQLFFIFLLRLTWSNLQELAMPWALREVKALVARCRAHRRQSQSRSAAAAAATATATSADTAAAAAAAAAAATSARIRGGGRREGGGVMVGGDMHQSMYHMVGVEDNEGGNGGGDQKGGRQRSSEDLERAEGGSGSDEVVSPAESAYNTKAQYQLTDGIDVRRCGQCGGVGSVAVWRCVGVVWCGVRDGVERIKWWMPGYYDRNCRTTMHMCMRRAEIQICGEVIIWCEGFMCDAM